MLTMEEVLEYLRTCGVEGFAQTADELEKEYENEGKLKEEMLKDFVLHEKCSREMIDKYRDKVPPFLVEIWEEYGLGTFKNGYLKIINPDEYAELLNYAYYNMSTKIDSKDIPIIVNAFADIIVHDGSHHLAIINYRKMEFDPIPNGGILFYNGFHDKSKWKNRFDCDQYELAVQRLGVPAYNECFCYSPLLCSGGSKKVENIQFSDIKTCISDCITSSPITYLNAGVII